MRSICLQPLAPRLLPLSFAHPTEPTSLSFTPVVALLLGASCSARQNAEHSFRALALLSTFSSQHLPRRCSCLAFSSPSSPSAALLPLCFPLSSPSLFIFLSLSLSLSVVVDWVSECLWQLCVVCNRAERLVWIQRWENLFMWEMHRWRQVSRRCRLSLAVILHSGSDRRSEMAKYARRSTQIPKLHPTIQPMCVCVYSDLTDILCVWMHVCVHVFPACLIKFPCHGLGPGSITTER